MPECSTLCVKVETGFNINPVQGKAAGKPQHPPPFLTPLINIKGFFIPSVSPASKGGTEEQQDVPARRAWAENELQIIKDVGNRRKASCAGSWEGRAKRGAAGDQK